MNEFFLRHFFESILLKLLVSNLHVIKKNLDYSKRFESFLS
jgi:hypothetical protein